MDQKQLMLVYFLTHECVQLKRHLAILDNNHSVDENYARKDMSDIFQ